MRKFIYLFISIFIYLSGSLNGQVINNQELEEKPGNKRNVLFNLEEIKVRWKKAALENCPGGPCPFISEPGPCSSIVATPTGPYSASISFVSPTTDGGSPITGYIVTATSTPSAPAKRKLSAIITVSGTSSPILVTGLTFGVNYIFSVVATNGVGSSPPVTTTTTVTPCNLNTAGMPSTSPTLTVNTALTPSITIATTSATGIGTATGLPAGVTAAWSGNTITISGTPTATGSFSYEIPLTGGCGSVKAMGSITVNGAPSCAVGTASSTPTLTVSTALTNITHTTTSATGIGTATGLPTGVTAAWSGNVITISGTPTATGTFNYTIPLTGTSCSAVNATGTITVTAACAAGTASSTPTLTVNTALTNITHATTSATGIGTAIGLPTGVSATWSGNTITISGTPTATGTFNYTIPLTGTSCSAVNATGTITVTAACAAGTASSTPTLTVNTALTNITHATTSATGIGTATGLPTGVTAAWSGNVITISGTPSATGTFNYTLPLTGTSCSAVNATGTITVNASGFITSGLILNLDASNTASYPGSGTTWTDLSGSSNNMSLLNGASYDSSNRNSILFDGVNDYAGRSSAMNTGQNFTVSVWMYATLLGSTRTSLVANSYNYSSGNGWFFCTNAGGTSNSFFLSIGSDNPVKVSSANILTLNTWNYLTAVIRSGGRYIDLYKNGVLISGSSTDFGARTINYTYANFSIGLRDPGGTTDPFKGNIGSTQIYDQALTAADILSNYNATKGRYGL